MKGAEEGDEATVRQGIIPGATQQVVEATVTSAPHEYRAKEIPYSLDLFF